MKSYDVQAVTTARKLYNSKGESLRATVTRLGYEKWYTNLNNKIHHKEKIEESFFFEIFKEVPIFYQILEQEQARFNLAPSNKIQTPDDMANEIARQLLQKMDMVTLIDRMEGMKQQIEDLKARIEQINKD